jgi:Ser-tRNA(Ala) deacylase AlaX
MKLHAATHVVFSLFSEKTGVKTLIGSNITSEKGRVDFEYPESVAMLLPEIEEKSNELFSKDIEIRTYADEKDPQRRLWQCGNILYPCGGTHPKSTKEIGKITLKRKNIGKGKERIEVYLAK